MNRALEKVRWYLMKWGWAKKDRAQALLMLTHAEAWAAELLDEIRVEKDRMEAVLDKDLQIVEVSNG